MTILESFAQIPIMFYISLFFLPITFYSYFVFSKPKKRISAAAANPSDQLKGVALDLRREMTAIISLGATIAFGLMLTLTIWGLIDDYKNSRNLFAESLSVASFPPLIENIYPPVPTDKILTVTAAESDQEDPADGSESADEVE